MSGNITDEDESKMSKEIAKLSGELGKVLAEYLTNNKMGSLLVIPVMAIALADCIAKISDSADKAMGIKDNRKKLMVLVNKFVEERPDCIRDNSRGH